jgi:hypothetical protein
MRVIMDGVEARGGSHDDLIFVERRCRDAFRAQPIDSTRGSPV